MTRALTGIGIIFVALVWNQPPVAGGVAQRGPELFMTQVRERQPVRTRELVLVQNWTRELDGQGPPRR
jgi:hypothetical protein